MIKGLLNLRCLLKYRSLTNSNQLNEHVEAAINKMENTDSHLNYNFSNAHVQIWTNSLLILYFWDLKFQK